MFRLYIASSLDGFAATSDGSVDWLSDYPADELGFADFFDGIDTVIMGRRTYSQVRGFPEWPYAGKRVSVLSSTPLDDLPDGAACENCDFGELAQRYRKEQRGDCWIVGGPETIHRAFAADVIDRFELYIIPRLLGEGLPLLSWSTGARTLTLTRSLAFTNGVVLLDYAVPKLAAPQDTAVSVQT
jgi:dihydrofolate reductase